MTAGAAGTAPAPIRLDLALLPAALRDLSHPPAGLWCLGDPAVLSEGQFVAIVGTREASAYGERTAARLAAACARVGLVVVSGMARGIDAAAHRAAMAAGGRTIAVQGTGVDVPYPAGHRALHAAIQAQGAVVSEVPPGTLAFPGCFPRRNRIIAALARVTVVVEAGFKSGAINTASQALELGRSVAAVPGQIDDPRAAGSNILIRDGAHVITDVEDLLTTFGLSTGLGTENTSQVQQIGGDPDSPDGRVLVAVGRGLWSVEAIAAEAGLSTSQTAESLLRLELFGLVGRSREGYRRAGG
ncbi:MAG: DNA-processing protein DprA [Gemmatimonadaceae bacterium]